MDDESTQRDTDIILHQREVEELIDSRLASAGGGTGDLGTVSWIATTFSSPITLSNGSVVDMIWSDPPDGAEGSDITLAVDGKTFTLVETGLYSIMYLPSVDPNAAAKATTAAIKAGIQAAGLNVADPFPIAGPLNLMRPASLGYLEIPLSIPAMKFSAGTTLVFYAQLNGWTTGTAVFRGEVIITKVR